MLTSMIKLARLTVTGTDTLELTFTDGSAARWSAAALIARDTVMTRPLGDPAYFARAFIEDGALAWPNGFELSADALHQRLAANGALTCDAA
ncbi:DUF2442 domain-containing protein [Sphingomonas aurantiaca]|uniref:Uncharacterized protein DUF2442 n=1 Tax=Sphingomonas aurantiaca TaxID=185949 RepID=A0A2T5GSV3_9SPHN|nr:DUF2442 domain-containing protein [Sphingomonas aurantiaca]PTQ62422.1 uncharacterized protein DUF2442 [Sphingomonas aurantiaca]